MNPEEQVKKETEDIYQQYYETKNNPAEVGSSAFRRAVENQLSENIRQRGAAQQTYSDLYQQARSQSLRGRALSNTSGFTGGMAEGAQAKLSAAEIGALTNIASAREGTMRELDLQKLAIPSNAMIEQQQSQAYEMDRLNQIGQILAQYEDTKDISDMDKQKLALLGYTEDLGGPSAKSSKRSIFSKFKPGETAFDKAEGIPDGQEKVMKQFGTFGPEIKLVSRDGYWYRVS